LLGKKSKGVSRKKTLPSSESQKRPKNKRGIIKGRNRKKYPNGKKKEGKHIWVQLGKGGEKRKISPEKEGGET